MKPKNSRSILRAFVLMTMMGNCIATGNLFIPALQRKATPRTMTPRRTHRETLKKYPYWLDKLKESIFKTISPEPLFNKEIYHAIFMAPFYGPQETISSTDSYKDTEVLASGDLRTDKNETWILCQNDCFNCPLCTNILSIQKLTWLVQRAKHLIAKDTFRYDLNIIITTFAQNRHRFGKGKILTDYVYSFKDFQPTKRDVSEKKKYLLSPDDYEMEEERSENEKDFYKHYDHSFLDGTNYIQERNDKKNTLDPEERVETPNGSEVTPVNEFPIVHRHQGRTNETLSRLKKLKYEKVYPDYYNLIYKEVLQALLSNDNFWKFIRQRGSECSENTTLQVEMENKFNEVKRESTRDVSKITVHDNGRGSNESQNEIAPKQSNESFAMPFSIDDWLEFQNFKSQQKLNTTDNLVSKYLEVDRNSNVVEDFKETSSAQSYPEDKNSTETYPSDLAIIRDKHVNESMETEYMNNTPLNAKQETEKELKLYKEILKQLALSVTSETSEPTSDMLVTT